MTKKWRKEKGTKSKIEVAGGWGKRFENIKSENMETEWMKITQWALFVREL